MKRIKLPKRITAKWLKDKGACNQGIRSFQSVFPNGAALTVRNVEKARRSDETRNLSSWLADVIGLEYRCECVACAHREPNKPDAWEAVTTAIRAAAKSASRKRARHTAATA